VENLDEQFEKYLGEFQPRRPHALPAPAISRQVWLRRFAATAVVTGALSAGLWSLMRKPPSQEAGDVRNNRPVALEKQAPRRALSIVELTHLAVENPSSLDAALEAAQKNRLPRFDRRDGTLRILAKE
jgi:hypothetical protein